MTGFLASDACSTCRGSFPGEDVAAPNGDTFAESACTLVDDAADSSITLSISCPPVEAKEVDMEDTEVDEGGQACFVVSACRTMLACPAGRVLLVEYFSYVPTCEEPTTTIICEPRIGLTARMRTAGSSNII